MRRCISIIFLILFSSTSHAEVLIFFDDFSRGLNADKWLTGATGGHPDTISVVDGQVAATANRNFIETLETFSGNLRVEMDVARFGNSEHPCWEYYIELTANGAVGSLRFYDGTDGVSVGNEGFGVCANQFITESTTESAGTVALHYIDSSIQFTYTNPNGDVLSSDVIYAEPFDMTTIKIWLAAHEDTPRFIDNIKVYALSEITTLQCQVQLAEAELTISNLHTELEISDTVISGLYDDLNQADSSIQALSDQLAASVFEKQQLEDEMVILSNELGNVRDELLSAQTQFELLADQVENKNLELERLSHELSSANSNVENLNQQLNTVNVEKQIIQTELDSAIVLVAQLTEQSRIQQQHQVELEQLVAQANAENESLRSEISQLSQQVLVKDNQLIELQGQNIQLTTVNSELKSELEMTAKGLDDILHRLSLPVRKRKKLPAIEYSGELGTLVNKIIKAIDTVNVKSGKQANIKKKWSNKFKDLNKADKKKNQYKKLKAIAKKIKVNVHKKIKMHESRR